MASRASNNHGASAQQLHVGNDFLSVDGVHDEQVAFHDVLVELEKGRPIDLTALEGFGVLREPQDRADPVAHVTGRPAHPRFLFVGIVEIEHEAGGALARVRDTAHSKVPDHTSATETSRAFGRHQSPHL